MLRELFSAYFLCTDLGTLQALSTMSDVQRYLLYCYYYRGFAGEIRLFSSAVFNKFNKVIVTVLSACVNGCLSYPDRDLVQSRVLNSRWQITDENLNVKRLKTMGQKNFRTKITKFL